MTASGEPVQARAGCGSGCLVCSRQRLAGDPVRVVAVVGVCALLWILRRPEQLTRPYLWGKESFIVRNFVDDGWAGASRSPHETSGNLSWNAEVRRCAASFESVTQIPIYFDGSNKTFWWLTLSPAQCRRLTNAYSPSG
jgi:hypothetical protein